MQPKWLYGSIKGLGFAVMGLMAIAICYAFTISVMHWSGIGV